MKGFKNYYRVKVGDYRLGIELVDKDTLALIVVAHRKDIYNRFP